MLEIALEIKALHGESPVWDERENVLYWIDGLGNRIHKYHPLNKADEYIEVSQCIGSIALKEDGDLIAALRDGIYFINFKTGECIEICDVERENPNTRFNDGKCDELGRFWAGTMWYDGTEEQQGSLYKIDTNLNITRMLKKVSISNGIVWNSSNTTMYYIDSPTKEIVAYDFDLITGKISNKRGAFRIPDDEGIPDGMTIDEEGMIWVAQWGGFKVSRWNPLTSKKIDEIKIPVKNVSSCAFGGIDLDELYITTARLDTDEKTLSKYPLSGSMFKVKTGVKGIASNRFIYK